MTERKIILDNWEEIYDRKLVSVEEAAKVIKSGDNVFIPSAYIGQVPAALTERYNELRNVTVEIQSPGALDWMNPGMEESFTIIPKTLVRSQAIEDIKAPIEEFLMFQRLFFFGFP